jgi:hypothetical protein
MAFLFFLQIFTRQHFQMPVFILVLHDTVSTAEGWCQGTDDGMTMKDG